MKSIGLILISLAFLSGSYLCVIQEIAVNWNFYGISIIMGSIGVVLIHLNKQKSAKSISHDINNMIMIEKSLSRIIDSIDKLKKQLTSISIYSITKKIDDTLLADIDLFIEHRKTIAYVYDLQSYSNIMSEFACGERYLNRVWCAAADGYVDEVEMYLGKAHEQFTKTQKQLNMVKHSHDPLKTSSAAILEPVTSSI
ncbi:MAG: hypothetical protein AB8G05_21225 [Oligoflexales bacterium]